MAGAGGTGTPDMITGNTFQQFANDPASLGSPAAVEQGKSLLGQIFGGSNAFVGHNHTRRPRSRTGRLPSGHDVARSRESADGIRL